MFSQNDDKAFVVRQKFFYKPLAIIVPAHYFGQMSKADIVFQTGGCIVSNRTDTLCHAVYQYIQLPKLCFKKPVLFIKVITFYIPVRIFVLMYNTVSSAKNFDNSVATVCLSVSDNPMSVFTLEFLMIFNVQVLHAIQFLIYRLRLILPVQWYVPCW